MKEHVFRVQVNHERRGSIFMVYNKTRLVMIQGNGRGTEALQRFLKDGQRDYFFGRLPIGARNLSQLEILRRAPWQGW